MKTKNFFCIHFNNTANEPVEQCCICNCIIFVGYTTLEFINYGWKLIKINNSRLLFFFIKIPTNLLEKLFYLYIHI